jgi:hypothetical protein
VKPKTPTLSDRDKDAYTRAIGWMQQQSAMSAAQIADKLRREGFEAAGEFAAYVAQCDNLRLRPWQAPPCSACGEPPDDPDIHGYRAALALRDRLERAGLSPFEPDPVAALAASSTRAASRAARK